MKGIEFIDIMRLPVGMRNLLSRTGRFRKVFIIIHWISTSIFMHSLYGPQGVFQTSSGQNFGQQILACCLPRDKDSLANGRRTANLRAKPRTSQRSPIGASPRGDDRRASHIFFPRDIRIFGKCGEKIANAMSKSFDFSRLECETPDGQVRCFARSQF